jgi:hypothetical protein
MTKNQLKRREATRRLFLEYLKTPSLRDLAQRSGISRSVLGYRFQAYVHADYANLARRGIFNVVRPHLLSKSRRIREEVSNWLVTNLEAIIQNELHSTIVVFSEKKLDRLTYTECGRLGDWKDHFAEVLPC